MQVQAKSLKMALVFLEEGEICYKMVYYTFHLRYVNRQKSCCKLQRWKKRGLSLKGF